MVTNSYCLILLATIRNKQRNVEDEVCVLNCINFWVVQKFYWSYPNFSCERAVDRSIRDPINFQNDIS